ncbi:hypothetical protein CLOLEP_03565 [[Clostridium] leptum DSM 753]|uniref:Uncharacterized protein n=1 Tax=[Clostridium] leptum DSM 753 TaxID=428125 RepID=A7VY88_9FIRM|nr:hypothetical protein CLOLEP_03565 [[Clostridium] leptum DSM 753]
MIDSSSKEYEGLTAVGLFDWRPVLRRRAAAGTMSTMGAAATAAFGYGKTGGDLPMGFAAAAACAGTFPEKIPDREKIQRT